MQLVSNFPVSSWQMRIESHILPTTQLPFQHSVNGITLQSIDKHQVKLEAISTFKMKGNVIHVTVFSIICVYSCVHQWVFETKSLNAWVLPVSVWYPSETKLIMELNVPLSVKEWWALLINKFPWNTPIYSWAIVNRMCDTFFGCLLYSQNQWKWATLILIFC